MKILLLFSIFILLFNPLKSQETLYGLKGGFVSGKFVGTDVREQPQGRIGITVNGFVEFPLTSVFRAEIGGVYTQKGGTMSEAIYTLSTVSGTVSATEHLNYVAISPVMKISFGDKFRVYGLAGFEIGSLLVNNRTLKAELNGIEIDPLVYYYFRVKNFNAELTYGAGVKFARCFLELRYNLGLTTIYQANEREARNTSISLSIGIMFNERFTRTQFVEPPTKSAEFNKKSKAKKAKVKKTHRFKPVWK